MQAGLKIIALESPGGGQGNPLQYSSLEKPHGQRSLAGSSPWGCKELDMTEQLCTMHICCIFVCVYIYIYIYIYMRRNIYILEKEMATHSRVLAWRIPGMADPGGLPSMGSHRVRHD